MLLSEAVVATKTQCSLCSLNSVCRGIRTRSGLALSSLEDSSRGTATGDVLVQIYQLRCVPERIANEWELHETTFRPAGNILRTKKDQ